MDDVCRRPRRRGLAAKDRAGFYSPEGICGSILSASLTCASHCQRLENRAEKGSRKGADMANDRPAVAPYLTVTPCLGAIAFYGAAFGAVQKALMPSLDGLRIMHCELAINGGSVF